MKVQLLIAAAVALVLPAAALAKGPDRASVSGPGLDRTIVLAGNGESGQGTLGALTMDGGFFPQMFGQSPSPLLPRRPAGSLGPRFTVRYRVPGPATPSHVRQELYLYAPGGALTYMRPGQTFWGTHKTVGGWYRAPQSLRSRLVRAGVPARPPSGGSGAGSGHAFGWAVGGAVVAALLIGLGGLALRRRPRPLPGT